MGEGNERNLPCHCGSDKKYKKCHWVEDQKVTTRQIMKKTAMRKTASFLIGKPYKNCPNQECLRENSFGVSIITEGAKSYTRECMECGHKVGYDLPSLKKKVLYLDQFIISNLVKLLDKSHRSHQRIKSELFWEKLFVKLEEASRVQAIICPDSFYHKDESLMGDIDFKLMRRLYEHFSSGKTFYPNYMVERHQISQHFEHWLEQQKTNFQLDPQDITFEKDLHDWSIGLRISVGGNPYPGQIEGLQKNNDKVRGLLGGVWQKWQQDKKTSFVDRVKEETLGFGVGLRNAHQQFIQRKNTAMVKMAQGEDYEFEFDDFIPPVTDDIFETLIRISRQKNIPQGDIPMVIIKYFNDANALLEIPTIRISSVMLAGLAHRALNGKKNPPKSTSDIQFISSYLPYCDALFVDKESFSILKEFPQNTPEHLRLKEFSPKIFSLANKEEFLSYLDELINDIPPTQISILKDVSGEDYAKPFWTIIEREKQKLKEKGNRKRR